MNTPRIAKVEEHGGACPYQIEATTIGGEYFYLRYRGGRLRAGVAPTHKEFWNGDWSKVNPYNIIDEQVGEDLDGWGNHKTISEKLKGKVIFPWWFMFESYPSKPQKLKAAIGQFFYNLYTKIVK